MIHSAILYDSRIKYETLAKGFVYSRIGIPKRFPNGKNANNLFLHIRIPISKA